MGGVVASIRRTVLPERVMVDLVPGANKDVQALLDAMVAGRRNVLERPRPEARPELARGEEDGALAQVGSGSFGPCRLPSVRPISLTPAYGSCRLPRCASACSRSSRCG